jgi:hypothetical protein
MSPASATPASKSAQLNGNLDKWLVKLPATVAAWGALWGQEHALKLSRGRLLDGRVLVGIDIRDWNPAPALTLASELGASVDALAVLRPHLARANAIFFGIEQRPSDTVFKIYLEFWDEVRRAVRLTGSREPRPLHLGVKWSSRDPTRHLVASYVCHPLVTMRDVLRRIDAVHGPAPAASVREISKTIIRLGMRRDPAASLLYLEASEEGTPRSSYDVNLYKTGLLVRDVEPQFREASKALGAASDIAFDQAFEGLRDRLLGHISGGIDREGGEFLSLYAEVRPLPADDAPQTTTAP